MPSVPSSAETSSLALTCPHASKVPAGQLFQSKEDGLIQINRVDSAVRPEVDSPGSANQVHLEAGCVALRVPT
ncbi:hypothetical protein AAFF_G00014470, partial [Aldrovandia affinis]